MSDHSKWLGTSALFIFMKWLNCDFFLCISSSLCKATNIFQTYDTLQVVFIECLFLFSFLFTFLYFLKNVLGYSTTP